MHLLPSTSAHGGSATFVVLPQGCQNLTSISTCTSSRGNTFSGNASTSWSLERLRNSGFYQMDLPAESQLGLANNAHYGFDTISLPPSGLPSAVMIQSQLIGGLSTNENFWLGTLGISPINFNCSDPSREVPNLLRTLKDEGHIESLSWGYTAGFYSNSFGSLRLEWSANSSSSAARILDGVVINVQQSKSKLDYKNYCRSVHLSVDH